MEQWAVRNLGKKTRLYKPSTPYSAPSLGDWAKHIRSTVLLMISVSRHSYYYTIGISFCALLKKDFHAILGYYGCSKHCETKNLSVILKVLFRSQKDLTHI